jgi:hypothetical protein
MGGCTDCGGGFGASPSLPTSIAGIPINLTTVAIALAAGYFLFGKQLGFKKNPLDLASKFGGASRAAKSATQDVIYALAGFVAAQPIKNAVSPYVGAYGQMAINAAAIGAIYFAGKFIFGDTAAKDAAIGGAIQVAKGLVAA